ncbi:unnamed protein product [Lactuca saligna]|uniref:F-box domain-containing protein n=1 Tax=Lactuca saligna TaxID=75948 RepID=A0AA35Z407_LACSI|nr:unnamed protein product [Lactuca saligna]
MKKSEPPKTSKPADGTDFISSMPDAILLLILSRVPSTEEAIRSSILSRRWRNLWTAIPSLYLDTTGDIEMPNCLVISPSLESLRLSLGHHGLRLPNIMGFPALRVLDLTSVDLLEDGNLVKAFLESCPLLEDLTLDDCVLCKLDLLCISCLKLKKLSIVNTYDDNDDDGDSLKKAEIEPKSEGNNMSVLFPGISGVEYLCIDPYFFIKCIYAAIDPGLPNLKTLVLSTTMDAFTMDNFNRILKYYPKLESLKLIIEQDFHGSDGTEYGWLDEDETREILSIDLKRVEFFEFNGEKPKVVIKWFDDILNMYFNWGELPFKFVENEAFVEYTNALNAKVVLPSRHTISRNVSKFYIEERTKMLQFLSNPKTAIHLTTDTWTSSCQRTTYMVVTAHFIDENWMMHKRIINFREIDSHKGEDMGRELLDCIRGWGMKNVMTITLDNAATNDKAMDFLVKKLPNLYEGGKHFQVRCMAHILNLIVKDGLKYQNYHVECIQKAVRYIRLSPQRINKFKKAMKDCGLQTKKFLCGDTPTRWNSTELDFRVIEVRI